MAEILREMVPNRDMGERYDADRMKVLMTVKVVGSKLKEKWKADLFARIEDVFELNVAEKIISDKLYFRLRKGMTNFNFSLPFPFFFVSFSFSFSFLLVLYFNSFLMICAECEVTTTQGGKIMITDCIGNAIEILALPNSFVPLDAEDQLLSLSTIKPPPIPSPAKKQQPKNDVTPNMVRPSPNSSGTPQSAMAEHFLANFHSEDPSVVRSPSLSIKGDANDSQMSVKKEQETINSHNPLLPMHMIPDPSFSLPTLHVPLPQSPLTPEITTTAIVLPQSPLTPDQPESPRTPLLASRTTSHFANQSPSSKSPQYPKSKSAHLDPDIGPNLGPNLGPSDGRKRKLSDASGRWEDAENKKKEKLEQDERGRDKEGRDREYDQREKERDRERERDKDRDNKAKERERERRERDSTDRERARDKDRDKDRDRERDRDTR